MAHGGASRLHWFLHPWEVCLVVDHWLIGESVLHYTVYTVTDLKYPFRKASTIASKYYSELYLR